MSMGPERKFRTNKVDPFLKSLKNGYFISIQQMSICGIPDKLGVIRGRFVAIELKAIGGKVAPLQDWVLSNIARCGGVAIVANPGNWSEVMLRLKKLDGDENDRNEI